jgi:hypothetical protein
MRITREQIKIFDQCAHQYFGEGAVLCLFGSRVDDSKKRRGLRFSSRNSLE